MEKRRIKEYGKGGETTCLLHQPPSSASSELLVSTATERVVDDDDKDIINANTNTNTNTNVTANIYDYRSIITNNDDDAYYYNIFRTTATTTTTKDDNHTHNQPHNDNDNDDDDLSIERNSSSSKSSSKNEIVRKQQYQQSTYWGLLQSNTNFRYFLLSYIVNRIGEWMTYLASISLIQEVSSSSSSISSNTSSTDSSLFDNSNNSNNKNYNTFLLSLLLLVKVLPNILFLPVGGILADSYDRLNVQIIIDILSSFTIGFYFWSLYTKSIPLLFVATFVQETFTGLYRPSNISMLPQLIVNHNNNSNRGRRNSNSNYHKDDNDDTNDDNDNNNDTIDIDDNEDEEELKKTTILYSLVVNIMPAALIGSSFVGGEGGGRGIGEEIGIVATVGRENCFIIDSLTYIISATLLCYGIQGNYNVRKSNIDYHRVEEEEEWKRKPYYDDDTSYVVNKYKFIYNDNNENNDSSNTTPSTLQMFVKGYQFAFRKKPMIGAYIFLKGTAALAYTYYGAVEVQIQNDDDDESESQQQLTSMTIMLCLLLGCSVGGVALTNLSHPQQITRLCIIGYLLISIGWFVMTLLLSRTTQHHYYSFSSSMMVVVVGSSSGSIILRSMGGTMIYITSLLLIQKFTPLPLLGRIQSIDASIELFCQALSTVVLGGGLVIL